MSYYRRKHKAQSKHRLGLLYIALAIVVVITVFSIRILLESRHIVRDSKTGCPVEGSPSYVAIVFDKTDSYNPIQKQYLKRYFRRLKTQLPTHSQIALYVIKAKNKNRITPEVIVCNPGTGKNSSVWSANPTLLKKRWREQFEIPLDKAIEEFMRSSTADSSPILEMVQIVSLSAFPTGSEKSDKQMIIVSDMLHHTTEWSHYRKQFDFESLHQIPYYKKIRTNLHGTEVQILYVRREGAQKLQTKRHAFFWADYMHSINGKVTLIEKIDG